MRGGRMKSGREEGREREGWIGRAWEEGYRKD